MFSTSRSWDNGVSTFVKDMWYIANNFLDIDVVLKSAKSILSFFFLEKI